MGNVARIWRIGVLSDSHGDQRGIQRAMAALQQGGALDMLCFLGDCIQDLPVIEGLLPQENTPVVHAVRGNNDLYAREPDACIAHIGGKKLLLVHGHRQRVKLHRLALVLQAEEAGADIALYGHTHMTDCCYERGILLLNPGAAGGARPTCALLTLQGGEVHPEILRL